ncbi:TIR domain-containing protein [Bradyrhizobium guangdongense]|uniref:TIR domain-containing protein n=1 Tax=Bradyrhizobium guangdongense TaxID=1325090 RepID=A0A410V0H6_9BRAD|nr:TIR domain-containing protein [Bradyrhizobium guangdongense]QAU37159.1 hypothetical protein X265_05250 [Bradyrhizobium guangdongense]QOZ58214.1 hypothetical protein XH86_05250 [Bradyrhizobium guangdongense]GGI21007.1 hypothetical protein GCM10010987_12220 [Bradyrhizobium guangdongense]
MNGAVDALTLQGFPAATDWSIARTLYCLEGLNGFGYQSRGINSPYLYGGSNLYGPPEARGGKFVRDHVFDPTFVDAQLGVATILKTLMELDPSVELGALRSLSQAEETLTQRAPSVEQSLNNLRADPTLVAHGRNGSRPRDAISEFHQQSRSADNRLIFVSYASPDKDRVVKYYDYLVSIGYDVWIDCRRLKAGQNWDFEIKRALNRAAIIIVFISNQSVDRRGYAQREIKIALDKAEEKLIDDIYVIPVLLNDDAPLPDQIRGIHIVKASDPSCEEQIKDAICHQLERLGENILQAQQSANIRWSRSTHREVWDGLPGYEIEYQVLSFSSDQYSHISEITDVINRTFRR